MKKSEITIHGASYWQSMTREQLIEEIIARDRAIETMEKFINTMGNRDEGEKNRRKPSK